MQEASEPPSLYHPLAPHEPHAWLSREGWRGEAGGPAGLLPPRALGWASIRAPRPARFVAGEVMPPPPIVPGKRAEASWEPLGAMNTGGAQEP